MSATYEPPLRVTIPLPCELPRGRGRSSTGRYGGNYRIRLTNDEYNMIQQEAAELGISMAAFGRWCVKQIAMQLREHRTQQLTTTHVGDNVGDKGS